jgi:hypothetical protein
MYFLFDANKNVKEAQGRCDCLALPYWRMQILTDLDFVWVF